MRMILLISSWHLMIQIYSFGPPFPMRYMFAHAISLSHPGIRCRCLAAYGDAVSAVKWASRLGREHRDDLAQFLLGMGYATEALHLPGISKRMHVDEPDSFISRKSEDCFFFVLYNLEY